ncbi:MAG TPA: Xaa-Pro peptidase family protein [Gaiellaceae bacterium]|nr:Xaa-Pro peptidase family protein [Gaiellaceae bacterium]
MTRLDRLAAGLDEPLLVTRGVNVRYLTGLTSSNAAVLVEPAGDATLYTDFRYAEAASSVPDVTAVETGRYLVQELAVLLAGRRLAFEAEHLSFADHARLVAGGVELVPAHGAVERLRAVKEPAEADAVRRAAALSDAVFAELAGERFTGRSERELAWHVERRFRELGAEGASFGTVVGSGPNGARPHVEPGERTIGAGELVVVDAGAVVDGYCSGCTRTFATGPLPSDLAEAYAVCLEAELAGLAAVRPGVTGAEADAAARAVIEAAGLGERFGHGLGHGVGLEVHEAPTLRPGAENVLETGNVVTVEPGIYLPGRGGVRIEDLVLVTADGCEQLNGVTKELTVVG